MDETGFTQTMPATSGSKINSSNIPYADDEDFDDSFGDFNDFEAGNDDFGDFAAGTATSPQPVDSFGTCQHDDTIPKSDFHASEHDIHGNFSVNDDARQDLHKEEEDIASPTLQAQPTRDETVHEKQDRKTDNLYSVVEDDVFEDVENGVIEISSSASQANIPSQTLVEPAAAPPIDDQMSNVDSVSTATSPASNVEYQASSKDPGTSSKPETTPVSSLAPDDAVASVGNEPGVADHSQSSSSLHEGDEEFSNGSRNLEDINSNDINSSMEDEDLGILGQTKSRDKVDDSESPSAIDNEESFNESSSFDNMDVREEDSQFNRLDNSGDHEDTDDFGLLDVENAKQNKVDGFEPHETTVNRDPDHNEISDGGEADEFGGFDNDDDGFGDDDEFGGFDDNDGFDDADDFGSLNGNNDDDGFDDFDRASIENAPPVPSSDNALQSSPLVATPFQEIPVNVKNALNVSNFDNPDGACQVWDTVLAHMMPNARDYDSINSIEETQAVKDFVMNAHESLLPTITWHALTVDTDDDNGIPKVQWRNSRIEKMHLDALKCWRGNAIGSPTLTSPKPFSQKGMSPPTSSSKPVADKNVKSDQVTSPVLNNTKVDIPKGNHPAPSPKSPVDSETIPKVATSNSINNTVSSKLDEALSPKLDGLPNLPKIATSKLPSSDSAPTSAASVKSLDMPSISQVVNQIDSSLRHSSQQMKSPVVPHQPEPTESQASLDSSNRPSTNAQSPELIKRHHSLGNRRTRSPSPTPASHSFRSMPTARPLTPTRFNPQSQSRVSSPGPTTASTPDESSPKLTAESPLNVSAEVLATSPSESSMISATSEKQPSKAQHPQIDNSPPVMEYAQTTSSPVTSPAATMSDTMDSWLSTNDMSFLDALGGKTSNVKATPGLVNSLSRDLKDSSMDIFGGFETAIEKVPAKSPSRSSTMPDISQSLHPQPQTTYVDSYGSLPSHMTPSTPSTQMPRFSEFDSVDTLQASPIKSASLPPVLPVASANTLVQPHSNVLPSGSPSIVEAEPAKRDSWLSSNDMSFLDSFGGSVASPVKNDETPSSEEFSDFVSQSPNAIPAGQPKSPAVQPSSHFAPKMQANRLSQASLSPVTTPSTRGSEKRDSWLSSNDISFLDTLGGSGGNMTSKTNSKSKQIGLGIMDLDMFETNTVQSGPRATPPKAANARANVPTKPNALQYDMPGGLSSELSFRSTTTPSWPNTNPLSRQNHQPLAALQTKPTKAGAPPSGNKNLFDGFNDFGDFTSSVSPAQAIPVAHPSSPEDAKWDIFRSASMSGSLSEWSSSLRSPPTVERMQPRAMEPVQQQVSSFMTPSQTAASSTAFDDFGDFTTATEDGGDDFGDFGSPDTTWNNDQTFSSSNGWL